MIMCKINYYGNDMQYADSQEIKMKADSLIREKLSFMGPIMRIDSIKDKNMQFAGIDKLILFSNGKTLKLEEKVRRKDYGDLLIEIIADNNFATYDHNTNVFESTQPRGIGWGMKDYSSDLLFYFIETESKGFIFSWKKFQAIFKGYLPIWYKLALEKKQGFSLKIAKNKGYDTINIAVPKNVFFNEYVKLGGRIL